MLLAKNKNSKLSIACLRIKRSPPQLQTRSGHIWQHKCLSRAKLHARVAWDDQRYRNILWRSTPRLATGVALLRHLFRIPSRWADWDYELMARPSLFLPSYIIPFLQIISHYTCCNGGSLMHKIGTWNLSSFSQNFYFSLIGAWTCGIGVFPATLFSSSIVSQWSHCPFCYASGLHVYTAHFLFSYITAFVTKSRSYVPPDVYNKFTRIIIISVHVHVHVLRLCTFFLYRKLIITAASGAINSHIE